MQSFPLSSALIHNHTQFFGGIAIAISTVNNGLVEPLY
jgi:hypothetical protein